MAGQSLDRELVLEALRTRLEALCSTLKAVTRKYRSPSQVDVREKPFAYIGAPNQAATVRRGAPSYWTLHVPVFLYFHADESDRSTPPSQLINGVVKEIEDALERQPTEPLWDMSELYSTNLGLTNVKAVRLVTVETDEGLLDVHGIAGLLIDIEATP